MKIAYITTSFGSLSHTFIRREIKELLKLGLDISLFGIRSETAKELSKKDKELIKETNYIYPLKLFKIIYSNIWFSLKKPTNYFKTLFNALFNEEINPFQHLKLIYHFFVSPYLALKIEKEKAKHIHAHFMNVPATIAMYCSRLTNIPFSITNHSAGINQLKEMIGLKQKLKKVQFVCTMSNYNKKYINKIYSCKQKIYIIRYGIDLKEYKGLKHKLKEKNKIKLLAIGRLVEKKGFRYLIEAINILQKEKINLSLNLIGDGPLKKNLISSSKKYKLDNINFNGSLSQDEIKKKLDNSDIIIVPSIVSSTGEKEGIPNVILEAMAMNVPVIATNHAGIPEIVKHKETGIIIPEKKSLAIAEAVKLFAKDNNLRKICIENGRKLVSEEFNIKKIAKFKKKIFEENIL
jgi:glycosyltransferase involved in cell wall biosynthesis